MVVLHMSRPMPITLGNRRTDPGAIFAIVAVHELAFMYRGSACSPVSRAGL
jgi:hypothetical protein